MQEASPPSASTFSSPTSPETPSGTDLLAADELLRLVESVFAPTADDTGLLVLTDLPDARLPDHPRWQARRQLAASWAEMLASSASELGFDTELALITHAGSNNADLPETALCFTDLADLQAIDSAASGNEDHEALSEGWQATSTPLRDLFERHSMVMAVTELSATAPLKLLAPEFGFRAATMGGFRAEMLPALRLDFRQVDRRVRHLAALLDQADGARLAFRVGTDDYQLMLDLRHRNGHASGGLIHRLGTAGNVPSGEAYIVPYEGEISGDPSRTHGTLPVELDGEVVLYDIELNSARAVRGDGPRAELERQKLIDEPAYGNMAELGLGVLADFGIEPIGSTLLDEKLGLHVAFGRSDHFGGQVGAEDFTSPDAVVHIDRVYLPATQPQVQATEVDLIIDGEHRPLMRDGNYTIDDW